MRLLHLKLNITLFSHPCIIKNTSINPPVHLKRYKHFQTTTEQKENHQTTIVIHIILPGVCVCVCDNEGSYTATLVLYIFLWAFAFEICGQKCSKKLPTTALLFSMASFHNYFPSFLLIFERNNLNCSVTVQVTVRKKGGEGEGERSQGLPKRSSAL